MPLVFSILSAKMFVQLKCRDRNYKLSKLAQYLLCKAKNTILDLIKSVLKERRKQFLFAIFDVNHRIYESCILQKHRLGSFHVLNLKLCLFPQTENISAPLHVRSTRASHSCDQHVLHILVINTCFTYLWSTRVSHSCDQHVFHILVNNTR